MVTRKFMPILGSLSLVVLALGVFVLNSGATQKTIVLSDAELMVVEGGTCGSDCNSPNSCPLGCSYHPAIGYYKIKALTAYTCSSTGSGNCVVNGSVQCGMVYTYTNALCSQGESFHNYAYTDGCFP